MRLGNDGWADIRIVSDMFGDSLRSSRLSTGVPNHRFGILSRSTARALIIGKTGKGSANTFAHPSN